MKCLYKLTTDFVYDEENKEYVTYGIVAEDAFGKVIKSFSDVFFDKAKAEQLIALCNKEKLSLIRLEDIVEDALTKQYSHTPLAFCETQFHSTVFVCKEKVFHDFLSFFFRFLFYNKRKMPFFFPPICNTSLYHIQQPAAEDAHLG